jgi:hypothetical protein
MGLTEIRIEPRPESKKPTFEHTPRPEDTKGIVLDAV